MGEGLTPFIVGELILPVASSLYELQFVFDFVFARRAARECEIPIPNIVFTGCQMLCKGINENQTKMTQGYLTNLIIADGPEPFCPGPLFLQIE